MGIEPTPRAWEAPILPLNYARTSLTLPNPTVSCKKSPYRWRRYFLPIPIWEGDAIISFVIICNNDCARCIDSDPDHKNRPRRLLLGERCPGSRSSRGSRQGMLCRKENA